MDMLIYLQKMRQMYMIEIVNVQKQGYLEPSTDQKPKDAL